MNRRHRYFLKQKLIGVGLLLLTAITAVFCTNDVAGHAAMIFIPYGLFCIFTDKMFWQDDYFWEVKGDEIRERIRKENEED